VRTARTHRTTIRSGGNAVGQCQSAPYCGGGGCGSGLRTDSCCLPTALMRDLAAVGFDEDHGADGDDLPVGGGPISAPLLMTRHDLDGTTMASTTRLVISPRASRVESGASGRGKSHHARLAAGRAHGLRRSSRTSATLAIRSCC
jgi:hypothetical protein